MPLAFEIKKEQFDALPADLKGIYSESSSGNYIMAIDVNNHPDVQGLIKNKERMLSEKKILAEKLDELEAAASSANRERLEKANEWKKIAEENEAKFSKSLEEAEKKNAVLLEQLKSHMVEAKAMEVATSLAGENANLLLPHVKSRFKAEVAEDGKLQVYILDAANNVSNMDADALANDFRSNKAFHPLIKGVQSSGSSAGGHYGTPSQHSEYEKFFDPKSPEFNRTEQFRMASENPEAYQALKNKFSLPENRGFHIKRGNK